MTFTVQHKRSSTADKRPAPAELVDGQVAVNYNAAAPGLFFKTSSGTLVKAGPAFVGSTAPTPTNYTELSVGEGWLDTSTQPAIFKIWDGAQWVDAGSGGGGGTKGQKGAQGAQGQQGPAGDKGNIGQKGADGAASAKGQKGTAGAKGNTGTAGTNGTKGQKGEQGEGDKGQKGADGAASAKGQKGDTGTAGDKGQKGDDGTAGNDGDKGQKGADGAASAKGQKGDDGTAGDKGQKGDDGQKGATGSGDKGQKGDDGTAGTKGQKGDDGTAGVKGDTGQKGEAGSAGAPGGADTQVQFNDGGAFAGDANFTFNADDDILSVTEIDGDLNGPVIFAAKSGEALAVGDVVFISGTSGNFPVVSKAQANSAATMPAMGVVQDAAAGVDEDVNVVTLGTFGNFDTDTPGWAINDTLYVSATTAGALENAAPATEANLIQNIGKVMRVDASVGSFKVGGAGRTNATPNLNDGNIFVGNASNQAEADAFNDVIEAQAGIAVAVDSLTFDRDLLPSADNTIDLGSAGARFANIFTGDLQLNNEGRGNDVDGSSGNWTLQEGADCLFLIDNNTGKQFRISMEPV